MVDSRHKLTGDTALIMAAKCGNKEAVSLLLGYGADITLQNESMENAFDVASPEIQQLIIGVCVFVGAHVHACVCVGVLS